MANKFKIARNPPRHDRMHDAITGELRKSTLPERLAVAALEEVRTGVRPRLATWPGAGRLPPRRRPSLPLALIPREPEKLSEKAQARRAAKAAEALRGFTPSLPGVRLRKMRRAGYERDAAFRAANGIAEAGQPVVKPRRGILSAGAFAALLRKLGWTLGPKEAARV